MKLNITNANEPGPDGTYAHIGSKGGTEMMAERIQQILAPHLKEQFNLIHSRVRPEMIKPDKQNILVLHDTWDDPEAAHLADPASRARFAKFVFVSNHQLNTFNLAHGVPYADSYVLRNAIDPIELTDDWDEKEEGNTLRLIYHTTPHRGLEILVPVFEKLAEIHPNIHLDVFSSFGIYGWTHRDAPYKSLFDKIRQHPQMTYHEHQPNDVVRDYLKRAHIYAYPCIWPETSCISAIEALSAGCQIVTSNLAALPETCASFAEMYPFNEDINEHANVFANTLNRTIHQYKNNSILRSRLRFQKVYYDNFYSWKLRSAEWNSFLDSLYRPG